MPDFMHELYIPVKNILICSYSRPSIFNTVN